MYNLFASIVLDRTGPRVRLYTNIYIFQIVPYAYVLSDFSLSGGTSRGTAALETISVPPSSLERFVAGKPTNRSREDATCVCVCVCVFVCVCVCVCVY